jgi:MFS family permease
MLSKIIHRLLRRRHFWRYATFSEVAELYTSRMLTMFALRFVMAFGSVYLYKLGYSLLFIALFWAAYYFAKMLFAWPAAKIAARLGPKHGMLIANITWVFAMPFLALVPVGGMWTLICWLLLQSFAGSTNNISYTVDFSKVKNSEHAGKEIGYMNIIEKLANALSPLIGGICASVIGPVALMVIAAVCFFISAVPLFASREPTRLRQKLSIKGFPWRLTWRSLFAQTSGGIDIITTGTFWNLYIVAVIFVADGNEVYAKFGALISLTLVVTLIASYLYGRLIDGRQGLLLLRTSVVVNSLTHLFRPTVSTPLGIIATGIANDAATAGSQMAFTRGEFDLADRSGHRIMYVYLMEITSNFGGVLACLLFAACVQVFDRQGAFGVYFVAAAFLTLPIMAARFPLYKR